MADDRIVIGEIVEEEGGAVIRDLYERKRRVPVAVDASLDVGAIVRAAADGRIVEILAPAGAALGDIYRVAARFGCDPRYPVAVDTETARLVAAPGLDDSDLVDLTDTPFVTIDNDDSRDLDQALFIAEDEAGGGYVIDYALADASYYVRPGSALFEEALSRGASYYLPGLSVPMLPRALSEGIVSLNEGVLRRALVMRMRVGADGESKGARLFRARINSRAKLAYDGVQAFYDAPTESPLRGRAFTRSLELLQVVGKLRIARAEARDIVRYNRVNLAVGYADDLGQRFVALGERRNDTEKYNEQVSLLCNVEGARMLERALGAAPDMQAVFRVHPAPEPPRYDDLEHVIDAIIADRGLSAKVWRWRRGRGESLAAYLDRLPKKADADQRVFRAIQRQALVMNHRSSFTDEPGPHHGVGAPHYSRFSSPMREVVGIFTHKEALEAARGGVGKPGDAALQERVIDAANRAKERQRQLTKEANKLVIDELFEGDLARPVAERPVRRGTVLGVRDGKLYVHLDAAPLEVKVYAKQLAKVLGGRVEEERAALTMVLPDRTVRFGLGGSVELVVAGYDADRRRWQLTPRALSAGD